MTAPTRGRSAHGTTLVLGLGNPLMTDDGIGLAALERLRDGWTLPDEVVLRDGGTWGLRLLPDVEDAARLLLLDAVDVGAEPGTVVVLERDELPRFLSHKLSPHQVGVRDLLALADLRGALPKETVAMGIQPARVELGPDISSESHAAMAGLVGRVLRRLERWGHRVREPEGGEVACTR